MTIFSKFESLMFPKEDFSQESKTKIKITTTEGEKQF